MTLDGKWLANIMAMVAMGGNERQRMAMVLRVEVDGGRWQMVARSGNG